MSSDELIKSEKVSEVTIEATRPLAAAGVQDQPRDLVCFALYVLFTLWICSRPNLHLIQKKLGCAIMTLGTFIPNAKFLYGDSAVIYFPYTLVLSVSVGCLCSLLGTLLPLPYPRSSLRVLRRRARFHAFATRALLETQLAFSLTHNVSALAFAEALLIAIDKNAASMKGLLKFAKIELGLPFLAVLPAQRVAAAKLTALVEYCATHVPPLRESLLALDGQYHRSTQVAASHVKFLSIVAEAAHEEILAFSDALIAFVDLSTASSFLDADDASNRLKASKDRLKAAQSDYGFKDRHAFNAVFRRDGPMFEEPKHAMDEAARAEQLVQRLTLRAARKELLRSGVSKMPDLTGVARKAMKCCGGGGGSGGSEEDSKPPLSSGISDLFVSIVVLLFGLPKSRGHLFSAWKNALALSLAASLTFIHPLRFKSRQYAEDGSDDEIIYIHEQTHWAAMTICFMLTEKNDLSRLRIAFERLVGTLFGATYSAVFASYVLVAFDDGSCLDTTTYNATLDGWYYASGECWKDLYGHRVALVLITLPMQFMCSQFSGYMFAVASITTELIAGGLGGMDHDTGSQLALLRIIMTFLGCLLFTLAELLSPVSGQQLVVDSQPPIMARLGVEVEKAFSPFKELTEASQAAADAAAAANKNDDDEEDDDDEDDKPDMDKAPVESVGGTKAVKRIGKMLSLLPSAENEPRLWRPPFSRKLYEAALLELKRIAQLTEVITRQVERAGAELSGGLTHEELPMELMAEFAKFGEAASRALSAAAKGFAEEDLGAVAMHLGTLVAKTDGALVRAARTGLVQRAAAVSTSAPSSDPEGLDAMARPAVALCGVTQVHARGIAYSMRRLGEHMRDIQATALGVSVVTNGSLKYFTPVSQLMDVKSNSVGE